MLNGGWGGTGATLETSVCTMLREGAQRRYNFEDGRSKTDVSANDGDAPLTPASS